MHILLWPRSDADGRPGWLALWWETNRSSPYAVAWARDAITAVNLLIAK